jgi:hypothetical protein
LFSIFDILKKLFCILPIICCFYSQAQRVYNTQSVLNQGNWYKIAIKETGIYKIDLAFLISLGINTNNLSSNTLKIFGNTGKMLDENNSTPRYDDLAENAIEIVDGGDGIMNGSDYLLFYGLGTDYWLKDSINKRFIHEKNLYSEESYYYLTISTNGKRISNAINPSIFNTTVNSYNNRLFLEENTTNLISSGKNWVGQEFSNLPGKSLTKNYTVTLTNYLIGTPINFASSVLARSGTSTRFDISSNGSAIQQLILPPVTGGQLDLFATEQQVSSSFISTTATQNLTFNYIPSSSNAQGWLNWWQLQCRSNLLMTNTAALTFRDWNSVGIGNIASFNIGNAPTNLQVWDITDATNPIKQNGTINGNTYQFNTATPYLKEFIAFTSNFLTPTTKGVVPNQNLHGTTAVDFLIVTPESFLPYAQTLADIHRQKDNLLVGIATTNQIFNEFGSGIGDISAIRDFIKMYFDKFKTSVHPLKNVLLLGDASYDYLNRINNNTNFVPTWQSTNSTDPLQSYITDDFFGYLDDNENINGVTLNLLDVGIGRIPAKNNAEAKAYTDKVINYYQPKTLGTWRNQISLIADDEDGNLHLNDAEVLSGTLNTIAKSFVQDKIYLDAYQQESGSGGSRYPLVNTAINNKIFEGNLIWNYSGHGSYRRLADEAILDLDMVNNWKNEDKLPLFITATCDFAPYDDPQQFSIGENILLKPKAGAIALMTTTRIVFAFSNRIMNNNYLQFALQRNANNKYPNLGEANRLAKNYTTTNSGDIVNNRKFTLLGDPALTIAYPRYRVKTTKINNKPYTNAFIDTIKATSTVNIEGAVLGDNLTTFTNFNGTVAVTVYDKLQQIATLVNDPASITTNFQNLGNILFKGTAQVTNGLFTISFIAPKDMQYAFGLGNINYYAQNDTTDANGRDDIMIGGNGNISGIDNEGPEIKAYLNDTKFISGSLTNASPILHVYLTDSSGINTSNIGIGHEITAVLDGDTRNTIILNNYYQATINSYKKGSLQYPLPMLTTGYHSLTIKAWDVFNNANTTVLDFRVGDEGKLVIDRVLNYPNPFTTKTNFWFEHNKPNEDLLVNVTIFTLTGKQVKKLKETINTLGNRSCEITWDGKDEYGAKLARGTYIYQLSVRNLKGESIIKTEKLVKF